MNENQEVVKNSNNSSKKYITIITILSILLVSLCGYIVYDKFIKEDEKETKNVEEKKEEQQEKDQNEEPIQDKTNVDLGKCLNCQNNNKIKIMEKENSSVNGLVNVSIKDDKQTVEINILSNGINNYGGNINDKTITKKLNNNIKEVLIGAFGNDTGLATILYLMEDGTVEYTKIFDEVMKKDFNNLTDNQLFNTKKIENLNEIVRVEPVLIGEDLSIIAVKNNGDYYDLSVFIN